MSDKLAKPLIIAGVGGSGTRVVAEIVQHLGYYLGSFLNPAHDNLWFTFLFKRPIWYLQAQQNPDELYKIMDIFTQIMTAKFSPSPELEATLFAAAEDYLTWQAYYKRKLKLDLSLEKANDLVASVINLHPKDLSNYIGWGWKEPNSHLYLHNLNFYFPQASYIHVIRNGLDMAYSSNQQQYFNWGRILFDVEWVEEPNKKHYGALAYWLKANQRAIAIGKEQFKSRFLLLQFEQLCLQPQQEISKLLDFLGINEISSAELDKLAALPQLPSSYQRFKSQDLSIFSPKQLADIAALGYED
jgi:hypothetical protein